MKRRLCALALAALLLALAGCGGGKTLIEAADCGDWAEGFDTVTPGKLTIYREQNGLAEEPLAVTNPDTVRSAFQLLSALRVGGKGETEDELTVIFTFENGGVKKSFTFRGDCAEIGGKLRRCEGLEALFGAVGLADSAGVPVEPAGPDVPEPVEEPDTPEPPQETETPAPADTDGQYAVFTSAEMGMSFLYDPAYVTGGTGAGGAIVYAGGVEGIPYFAVYRFDGSAVTPHDYMESALYEAQMEYGGEYGNGSLSPAELTMGDYTVGGVALRGVTYTYTDPVTQQRVGAYLLADLNGGSGAVYEGYCTESSQTAIEQGLGLAASTFQPSADYYQ